MIGVPYLELKLNPQKGDVVAINLVDDPEGEWSCEHFKTGTYNKKIENISEMRVYVENEDLPLIHLSDIQFILDKELLNKEVRGTVYTDHKNQSRYFSLDDDFMDGKPKIEFKAPPVYTSGDTEYHIRSITGAFEVYDSLKEFIETINIPLAKEEREQMIERGKKALENFNK